MKTRTLSYIEPTLDSLGSNIQFVGEEYAVRYMRHTAEVEFGCPDCYEDDEEALEDFITVYWAVVEDEG